MPDVGGVNLLGYVQKQLFAAPVDILQRSMQNLEAKHYEAVKTQADLATAIGQLDLNEAEDGYRANLQTSIAEQIDNAATVGNYASALTTARTLAGRVAADPGLMGRVKYQADWKKFRESVLASKEYGQDVKNYTLEKSKYAYEDNLDENGKVVGGNTFDPNYRPVETVDLAAIQEKAAKLAAYDAGGSEQLYYMNSKGGFTNDFNQSYDQMAYIKKGGHYEKLGRDKLEAALNNLLDTTPGARASIDQDYNVGLWKTAGENAKSEAPVINEFTDNKGIPLSKDEYLKKLTDPFYKYASYNRQYSTMAEGAGMSASMYRNRNKTNTNDTPLSRDVPSTAGTNMAVTAGNAKSILDGYMQAETGMKSMYSKYNYTPGIADDRDVVRNELFARIDKSSATEAAKDEEKRAYLRNEIEADKMQLIRGDVLTDATLEQRQAIDFESMVANGIPPDGQTGNKFWDDAIKKLAKVFDGNTIAAGLVFDRPSDKDAFADFLGGNLKFDDKYNNAIYVSKDNPTALLELNHQFNLFRDQFSEKVKAEFAKTDGNTYTSIKKLKHTPVNTKNPMVQGARMDGIFDNDVIKDASKIANSYLKSDKPFNVTPTIYGILDLVDSRIDAEEIDENTKAARKSVARKQMASDVGRAIGGAGGSQYDQYFVAQNDGSLKKVDDGKDRQANFNNLLNILGSNNSERVNITYGTAPGGLQGTYFNVAADIGNNSSKGGAPEGFSMFVPDLIVSEIATAIKNEPMMAANLELSKAEYSTVRSVQLTSPSMSKVIPPMSIDITDNGYMLNSRSSNGKNSPVRLTKNESEQLIATSHALEEFIVSVRAKKGRNINISDADNEAITQMLSTFVCLTNDIPVGTKPDDLPSDKQGLINRIVQDIFTQ